MNIFILCAGWIARNIFFFLSSPVGNVISLMSTDIPRDFQRHYVLDHFTVLEPSRHQAFSLCISISSRRLFASSFIGFSIIALPSGRGVRGACMLEAWLQIELGNVGKLFQLFSSRAPTLSLSISLYKYTKLIIDDCHGKKITGGTYN